MSSARLGVGFGASRFSHVFGRNNRRMNDKRSHREGQLVLLNAAAARSARHAIELASRLRIEVHEQAKGIVLDCGINRPGGMEAGLWLARLCLADLAMVRLLPADPTRFVSRQLVQVATDHPTDACLRSQYAGWPLKVGKYFAMASGPMRSVRGREPVLEDLASPEQADEVVGVLESDQAPDPAVIEEVLAQCPGATRAVLAVAPTTSLAGNLQVVARSVETALHKVHACGFDPRRIISAVGHAPLPPPAATTIAAIGRTNDAILYGAQVTLWVDAAREELARLGPQIPSQSSSDFGRPFEAIFRDYDCDFYKLDPALFSPAEVELISIRDGQSLVFGGVRTDVLQQSFGAIERP